MAWIAVLKNLDARRKDKKSSTPVSKRKLPGLVTTVQTPVPPPGEDMVSFHRHTQALQAEYKKSTHNQHVTGPKLKFPIDSKYRIPTCHTDLGFHAKCRIMPHHISFNFNLVHYC